MVVVGRAEGVVVVGGGMQRLEGVARDVVIVVLVLSGFRRVGWQITVGLRMERG